MSSSDDKIIEVPMDMLYTAEEQYQDGCDLFRKGSYQEAEELLRRAAERGHEKAHDLLPKVPATAAYAKAYQFTQKGDYAAAFPHTLRSAQLGLADSQFLVGTMYLTGNGIDADYAEAVRWLQAALDQGFEKAQPLLKKAQSRMAYEEARPYLNDGNYAAAFEPLLRAAQLGHEEGQYQLGRLYQAGWGTEASESEAMRWFQAAADQGHRQAHWDAHWLKCKRLIAQVEADAKAGRLNAEDVYQLGVLLNVNNDPSDTRSQRKALKCFQKAAELGHEGAKAERPVVEGLVCLDDARAAEVVNNLDGAVERYLRAAQLGNTEAQYRLGHIYRTGYGYYCARSGPNPGPSIPIDRAEALRWYRLAAEQGDERAIKELAELETELQKPE